MSWRVLTLVIEGLDHDAATMTSAPSPDGLPNEVARPCERRRVVFGEFLCDEGPERKEVVGEDGVAYSVFPFHTGLSVQSLPTDEIPELPRLYASGLAGRGFCAFLREAMLSEDAHDVYKYESGESAEEDGLRKGGMRLRWEYGPIMALGIHLTISTDATHVAIWFRLEPKADAGKYYLQWKLVVTTIN